jgi:hypothetical protein
MAEIGKLQADFYLSLSDKREEAAAVALSHLENLLHTKNDDILGEIVLDCRKKLGTLLRTKYTAIIQQLLVACRKRLHAKVGVGSVEGQSHTWRHLRTLVELLGEWSNCVTELGELSISSETLVVTLDPLHSIVIEMSFDCFQQFSKDKNLDSWQKRMRNFLSQEAEINITSLDQIIGQLAGMRAIVCQYQGFLKNLCDDNFLMITNHEMNEWRELDGHYIVLEYGYILGAIREAMKSKQELLEIQEGRVFALQCTEDIFFITQRSIERAISTGRGDVIFAICSKVVEVINPDSKEEGIDNIYDILTSRANFDRRIATWNKTNENVIDPGIDSTLTIKQVDGGSTITTSDVDEADGTSISTVSNAMGAVLDGDIATGVQALSSTFLGVAGGLLEVVAPVEAPLPHEQPVSAISVTDTIETYLGTLKNDLDNAIHNYGDDINHKLLQEDTIKNGNEILDLREATTLLSIEDASIQINSLCIPINSLILLISMTNVDSLGDIVPPEVRIDMDRSKRKYEEVMTSEVQAIVKAEFYGGFYTRMMGLGPILGSGVHLRLTIDALGSGDQTYDITGTVMEHRSDHSMLVRSVSACLRGDNTIRSSAFAVDNEETSAKYGWIATRFKPLLCNSGFIALLSELSTIFSNDIVEKMKTITFNEWGSILIQKEIQACADIFECVAAEVDTSVRIKMTKALWAGRIIALDQPGDIRRYKVPADVMDESTLRTLLSRRLEFKSEVIERVKLTY